MRIAMRFLHALSIGTALGAMISSHAANAQEAPMSAGDPVASTPPAESPTSVAENEQAATRGDIVVTARRRAERLTDVPISVVALGGESLAARGIERVDDLARAVPSLQTRPVAGRRSNSQYTLRGVSAVESLITQDPAVGIYVNEVYRARATGTNQSFFDIDNVQVLYGPQGTLFGRNSTGGAVLITTRKPTDRFEGQISAGYGNLDKYELTGMLNVPIGETLSIRLAGQRQKRDGYGTNLTTGRKLADIDSWAGRVSVLWRPSDSIENLTVGSYYKATEAGSLVKLNGYRPCGANFAADTSNRTAFAGLAAACSTGVSVFPTPAGSPSLRAALENFVRNVNPLLGNRETRLDATFRDFRGLDPLTSAGNLSSDPLERPRVFNLTNSTTVELSDDITFKNIFGYNDLRFIAGNDLDGTPFKIVDTFYLATNKQITNEFQLQFDFDRLTFTVGGLYFHERGRDIQNSIQNIIADTRQNVVGINESYAGFAQGTFKILPTLSLTAGGRVTHDKRTARYVNPRQFVLSSANPLVSNPTQAVNNIATCTLNGALDLLDGTRDCLGSVKANFTEPSYSVSLDWKPRQDLLFYVAHRSGYRSGGLQARVAIVSDAVAATVPRSFEPETVKDIELGFKGVFDVGDGARLRTNLALYKAWYDDLQRSVTVDTGCVVSAGAPLPAGCVAGTAATTTAINNVGSANIKGFEAEIGIAFDIGLDVSAFWGYVDGQYENFPIPAPNRAFPLPASPTFPGTISVAFPVPKHTVGATFSATPIDNAETGTVTFLTSFSYTASFFGEQSLPFLEPEARAPAQYSVNASLDWKNIMGSNFSAQGWVRNATNENQILGFTALTTSLGLTPSIVGEPRTYGLTMRYEFGR
ncbi:MAG: TonB-dependent receptor [Novosphingobium sp.]